MLDGTLFINLSATSLSDEGLRGFIGEQLVTHGLDPSRIGFEITETAAIADFDCARDLIQTLRRYGCKVSLDDFGTGMSSFSYLKSLTVDFIKIDGSFVRRMRREPVDSAIVEAVNNIAHISGIRTIAEFVEDDEVMRHLRSIGVDFAQGWAVEKPGPMPAT
ncbi:MAG TPA: EAL domain-containing protein [Thiolapillus brandeum]|uniref:EAL domain-containing protein n=1 Tax=Thiolapillus brandeum TaxID=1076588 RepID=A0A7C5N5T8_9GAMM|nr:EAL domain-containing protein [Thiolapillus brandeum]